MKGGKRSGAGRKPVHIDPEELEKLCVLQCTDQEIAGFFGVTNRTIERRKKNPVFAAAMERGRAKGRVSLRRNLWALAAKGDPRASIFLAKVVLGYKDSYSHELSASGGGAIQLSVVDVLLQRRDRVAADNQRIGPDTSPHQETEPHAKH
jgi:hypothetical protein